MSFEKDPPAGTDRSLSQQAYDRLRRRIIRLTLAPGQWVTERGLAADLGVGLAPVRAAMARLSLEGLLVTVPRRGYRVKTLTERDADQLFAAWRVVALEIIRLATPRMTPDALAAYDDLTRRTTARRAADDVDEVGVLLDHASEQWRLLAAIAGNAYLEDILVRFETQVNRLCALGLSVDPGMETLAMSERREEEIDQVFRRGDVATALTMTEDLLERIRRDFRLAFARSTETPAEQTGDESPRPHYPAAR